MSLVYPQSECFSTAFAHQTSLFLALVKLNVYPTERLLTKKRNHAIRWLRFRYIQNWLVTLRLRFHVIIVFVGLTLDTGMNMIFVKAQMRFESRNLK